MSNSFFVEMEKIQDGDHVDLRSCIANLAFNSAGLIPVITQCHKSGLVLMQAWMNESSIEKTLASGKMTYWSRSREEYWIKGKISGHIQYLKSMHFDCDGDSILCLVDQEGVACHTGRVSCFYLQVNSENQKVALCLPGCEKTFSGAQAQ